MLVAATKFITLDPGIDIGISMSPVRPSIEIGLSVSLTPLLEAIIGLGTKSTWNTRARVPVFPRGCALAVKRLGSVVTS